MGRSNERELAVRVLEEVASSSAYNNLALKRALKHNNNMTSEQKAFVTELVNGSLRNQIYLDYCIGHFSKTPIKKIKPFILNTLRMSAYQILFLNRIPNSAACNEAVKLVKARGYENLSGFVNGVLRSISRERVPLPEDTTRRLSVMYSCPEWLVEHFLRELGENDAEGVCAACISTPDISAAVNSLLTDPIELKRLLEAEGMRVQGSRYFDDILHISKTSDLSRSAAFNAGLFHVLDESSALAVRVLDPQPGAFMLDVCAAPGGKSLYAAYLMKTGKIFACDIHEHKINLINENSSRLRVSMIDAELSDARVFDAGLYEIADYLLIDAPCSGLGVLRKKPDIKYKQPDISALSALQREILQNCSQYVKKGGVLVYCTCTISSEENINNIRWFTENFPFTLQDITGFLPPGLDCASAREGYIQIIPNETMDGFFVARLKRE